MDNQPIFLIAIVIWADQLQLDVIFLALGLLEETDEQNYNCFDSHNLYIVYPSA